MEPADKELTVVPAPGMTVTSRFNEAWGAGTVLLVQGGHARVLFAHHPDRKPVTVPCRSLIVKRVGNWEAAAQAAVHPERTSKVRASAGARKKKTFATTTQEEAVRQFLQRYEGGFTGVAFTSSERDYKWHAHGLFLEQLGGSRLRELLAKGQVAEVASAALQAVGKTNLLSVFEKARLAQALRDEGYARAVFEALDRVLASQEPEEKSFRDYLDAIQNLPPSPGQRIATWPIATIFPFLANPEQHLLVKPRATQAAAERLQFDLQYQAAPSWKTYERALQLGRELRTQLAEHGCRDFIDVQSFIWVMGS